MLDFEEMDWNYWVCESNSEFGCSNTIESWVVRESEAAHARRRT